MQHHFGFSFDRLFYFKNVMRENERNYAAVLYCF